MRRPILAVVLNSLIVIAGLAALFGVEVRELPDVDRPVITVTTNYDGAAPETIDREVTGVIEGAMGRISGVSAISSRSSFGQSRVTVEFTDATDLNVAASDARDSIGRVVNQLPDDADEPRIVKADANSDAVIRIGVTSDTMSVEDLTDLVKNTVEDRLIAAPGVADLQIFGGARPDLPRGRGPDGAGEPGADARRRARRAGDGRLRQPGRVADRHRTRAWWCARRRRSTRPRRSGR